MLKGLIKFLTGIRLQCRPDAIRAMLHFHIVVHDGRIAHPELAALNYLDCSVCCRVMAEANVVLLQFMFCAVEMREENAFDLAVKVWVQQHEFPIRLLSLRYYIISAGA